jgi:toxin ParE1/3/4
LKPVRPDPAAQAEIRAEVQWYEGQRPGLGAQLLEEIERALRLIAAHPAIGGVVPYVRGIHPPPRRIPVGRFPFHIVYRELKDEIELVALAPVRRRPGYWRSRAE